MPLNQLSHVRSQKNRCLLCQLEPLFAEELENSQKTAPGSKAASAHGQQHVLRAASQTRHQHLRSATCDAI
jgi:hypothetical protein